MKQASGRPSKSGKRAPSAPATAAFHKRHVKNGSLRRDIFIKEFLVDLNATKAAERSGYSKKTAQEQGSRLLSNAIIQKAIRKALDKRAERLEYSKDEWLRELKIVGHSDLSNHIEINADTGAIQAKAFKAMPAESRRALESITETRTIHEDAKGEQSVVNEKVTFRLHPKVKALELLGEHFGWLKKNIKFSGSVDVNAVLSIEAMKKSAKDFQNADQYG